MRHARRQTGSTEPTAPGSFARSSLSAGRAAWILATVLASGGTALAGKTPPGAIPFDEALVQRLAAAVREQGPGYVPRTRHRTPDGAPIYTNRLILESSPYLRQHAHNPVNWYPWGDEAFEAARRTGRPVLLSIGYSTCHWCHVMEEESFEDEEIARFLNSRYVAIKVDREERPDLDAIYMSAVQLLSGRGGWPMTTWLTPDREPFFGGTYFPPRDGDRGTRTGFLTLLQRLDQAYRERPEEISSRAGELATAIRRNLESATPRGETPLGWNAVDLAVSQLAEQFDAELGGLRRAPKFPSNMPNRLLLRQHARTADEQALAMAALTLTRMAEGGIYDQIGGGFHRYSVDARWLVPHFEKMLYDNAQLATAYIEAWQHTRDPLYRRIAREVLDYVAREMTSPEGGFYSATDADSVTPGGEREEGFFFTWTVDELAGILQEEERRAVELRYGVTPGGNFEGRSILHVALPIEVVATRMQLDADVVRARLDSAASKLYRRRADRPAPLRDDKILTSWNGLMISAFARGGFVFGVQDYTQRAARAADLLLSELRSDGRLLRSYIDGRARHAGYLDDYAFFIAGLLDLFEVTGNLRWLEEALSLQRDLDTRYADERGGYFATSDDHETLLAREKPSGDGAEPSGNSVALMNLLRFHALTANDGFRAQADGMLDAFRGVLTRAPRVLPEMLLALDFKLAKPKEVVLVHDGDPARLEPFFNVLRGELFPRQVVVHLAESDVERFAKRLPIVLGKRSGRSGAKAYVCEAGICDLPTDDPGRFRSQLRNLGKASEARKK